MKKSTYLFILLLFISFTGFSQTFDWESQLISEGNNLNEMNIVNDTTTLLTGYNGVFMKSADLGLTWNKVPILTPTYDFTDLSINSNGVGFATTSDKKVINNPSGGEPDIYSHGVLLKTSDNGANWSLTDIFAIGTGEDPVSNPNASGCYAMSFSAVEVIDDNTALLGVEWYEHIVATGGKVSHAAVFKTVDGGTNWTVITDNDRYPMAIEVAETSIYFGGLKHLLKTVSGSDVVTDIYPNLVAVNDGDDNIFINDFTIISENEIYVTTSTDGIFKTIDKGETFTKLESGAPTGGNDLYKVNESVMIVLGTSSKSKVTTDGGSTWTSCYPGSTCYEIGGVFKDSLYGLAKSKVFKIAIADLVNSNFNWKEQVVSDGNNLQKMHIIDAENALIVGNKQAFVTTSNGGFVWAVADLPQLDVNAPKYDFTGLSTVGTVSYASTRRFKQYDYPSSSEYKDIYGHGLIFKSTDYWKTWELLDETNIGTGDDPSLNPSMEGCYSVDLGEIESVNADTAFVYVNWYDTVAGIDNKANHSRVFKTMDGGESWASATKDFGSSYITSINFIDENIGFISGNTLLLKTNDGNEFTDIYPAIYEADTEDTTKYIYGVHYVDENEWFVTTSTNGIFATSNGGTSYTKLSTIAGASAFYKADENTYVTMGPTSKTKISWDKGQSWKDCSPGQTVWGIGGVLDNSLVVMAKSYLFKIALSDLEKPSEEADILTFVLDEQTGDATFDAANHSISIEVAVETDVTSLKPTLTISEGATISPDTAITQDFTAPVTYTVKAQDQTTTIDWEVTVTVVATAIEEVNKLDMIKIYPNPVKDVLYISDLEKVDKIEIYSVLGNTVGSYNSDINKEINVSMFDTGIYFISFHNSDGKVSIKKFIKE